MQIKEIASQMTHKNEAELSVHEVLAVLGKKKWLALGFILIMTGAVFLVSILLPKQYDAIIVLSPVANSSTSGLLSGLNSVVSQFGGLGALTGLTPNSDSTKSESLAVLESEVLTEEYINRTQLLPTLFPKEWDAQAGRWRHPAAASTPTLWKGNKLFKDKIRRVSNDIKSGLVTLTITWTDPVTAAKWANGLVRLTNDYRRDKAIRDSERNIAFLTAEAAKTDVVGVRQAIYSILQTEISKMMLARGNDEYALKVVDPAIAPEKAASPRPLEWTLIGLFVSTMLTLILAFLWAALGHPRQK